MQEYEAMHVAKETGSENSEEILKPQLNINMSSKL
jgi:hypothetical protein